MCEDTPTSVARPDKARKSVLCVDHSPEMLEICTSILEADGYQVFTAGSDVEALQVLGLHQVGAVVVEDTLPGVTGVALAEKIKLAAGNVLVVIYSAEEKNSKDLPFVDSLLYKGKGPIALRKLIGTLLPK